MLQNAHPPTPLKKGGSCIGIAGGGAGLFELIVRGKYYGKNRPYGAKYKYIQRGKRIWYNPF